MLRQGWLFIYKFAKCKFDPKRLIAPPWDKDDCWFENLQNANFTKITFDDKTPWDKDQLEEKRDLIDAGAWSFSFLPKSYHDYSKYSEYFD